jgi:hypothetical protein
VGGCTISCRSADWARSCKSRGDSVSAVWFRRGIFPGRKAAAATEGRRRRGGADYRRRRAAEHRPRAVLTQFVRLYGVQNESVTVAGPEAGGGPRAAPGGPRPGAPRLRPGGRGRVPDSAGRGRGARCLRPSSPRVAVSRSAPRARSTPVAPASAAPRAATARRRGARRGRGRRSTRSPSRAPGRHCPFAPGA